MSISNTARTLVVLAAGLTLYSSPALAQQRSIVSIEARQWTAEPSGGFSVTGGYVYRGPISTLQGHYFFADYVTDQIWSLQYDGVSVSEFTNRTSQFAEDEGTIRNISSFGEDAAGNLYIVDLGGEVFRIENIVPNPTLGDMDNNGSLDFDDLNPMVLALTDPVAYEAAYGILPSRNGDIDGNGTVDFDDINPLVALLTSGGGGDASADLSAVPEPSALLLAALGALGLLGCGRRRRRRT